MPEGFSQYIWHVSRINDEWMMTKVTPDKIAVREMTLWEKVCWKVKRQWRLLKA